MFNISPLYFWCHKVIPLVYDDSLSYYEVVERCVQKINELIANNSELPDYIKQEIVNALSNSEALDEIIKDLLSQNNIVLKSDLTSNDIDMNTCATLYYTKTENYKPMQAFAVIDASPTFVGAFSSASGMYFKLRKFNKDWVQMGESDAFLGHANDIDTNGVDEIYVVGRYTNNDNVYQTNYVYIINTSDLTQKGNPWLVQYDGNPVNIGALAYNKLTKEFYIQSGTTVYVYDENKQWVRNVTLNEELKNKYSDQYPSMERQGSFWAGSELLCKVYAYPNTLAFYDMSDVNGKLVKMYNFPYKSETGNAMTELECGYKFGNDIWVSSFQRDNDQGFSSNTNCGAWNTIVKINPWTNVPTGYGQKANEFNHVTLYVDGSTTNSKHYGTTTYPYRTLSEAMSTLHSSIATEQPIDIACRVGTNVGILRGESFPSFRLNRWVKSGDEATTFEIEGISLLYSTCQIYNAHIKRNNATSGGEQVFPNTCYVRFCNAYFGYCEFDDPYNDGGHYCVECPSSTVTLRQCVLHADGGNSYACVHNSTESTVIHNGTTYNGTAIFQESGQFINASGVLSAKENPTKALLRPVDRLVIFTGELSHSGTYDINNDLPIGNGLAELNEFRSAIITLLHNTAYTEYRCYFNSAGNNTFCAQAISDYNAGNKCYIHAISGSFNYSTGVVTITRNISIDVSNGTRYNYDTSGDSLPFAKIVKIELC